MNRRLLFFLTMIVILIGAVVTLVIQRSQQLTTGKPLPRAGSQVALLNYQGGNFGDLYVLNTKTGELTQLTKGNKISRANWAPDGERMALVTGEEGEFTIFTPNDADLNKINTNQVPVTDAMWAPNGEQIALTDGKFIYVIDSDGTNMDELVEGDDPFWSPDGSQILFVLRDELKNDQYLSEIKVIDSDGSDLRTLLTFRGEAVKPTWSPDGEHIIFLEYVRVNYSVNGANLFIFELEGGNLRELEPPSKSDDARVYPYWFPSWSPYEQEILIENNFGSIYRYRLEDDEFEYVTSGQFPVWDRVGNRIAYKELFGNEICITPRPPSDHCVDLSMLGQVYPVGWRP